MYKPHLLENYQLTDKYRPSLLEKQLLMLPVCSSKSSLNNEKLSFHSLRKTQPQFSPLAKNTFLGIELYHWASV